MRYLMIMAMALGALAIPSSALANHGGNERDCEYAFGKNPNSGDLNPHPDQVLVVYADTSGYPHGQTAKAGACNDFSGTVTVGGNRFDGGTAEVGVGEDPAPTAGPDSGDPSVVPNQPDGWVVVDGDDDNVDPQGQSDGYVGVSHWESSDGRTTQEECQSSGPDNGVPNSSNSGGCLGVDNGPWVYVPGDLPTPMCGNSSGNAWDGSGSDGAHRRDGCQIP